MIEFRSLAFGDTRIFAPHPPDLINHYVFPCATILVECEVNALHPLYSMLRSGFHADLSQKVPPIAPPPLDRQPYRR